MSNEDRMHVWVGVCSADDATWAQYFDIEQYGKECGFCRETGMEWFDLDLFSSYNAGAVMPVDEVLEEVPMSEQFETALLDACRTYGVSEASHCVSLSDFSGQAEPGRAYCGLTYVGGFPFRRAG